MDDEFREEEIDGSLLLGDEESEDSDEEDPLEMGFHEETEADF